MRASRLLRASQDERGFERSGVADRSVRAEDEACCARDGRTRVAVLGAKNGVLFCLSFRVRGLMSGVMKELEVDFPGEEFHHALFQALPVPVLVVDKELDLWEYNPSAARTLVPAKPRKEQRALGDALNCTRWHEGHEGCGRETACADCTIQWVVRAAGEGQRITRRWARMEILASGKPMKVNLQVSSSPFTFGRHSLVLLVLEGLDD